VGRDDRGFAGLRDNFSVSVARLQAAHMVLRTVSALPDTSTRI
jgi:hypothetical protein